jgi:hypothetical protein
VRILEVHVREGYRKALIETASGRVLLTLEEGPNR